MMVVEVVDTVGMVAEMPEKVVGMVGMVGVRMLKGFMETLDQTLGQNNNSLDNPPRPKGSTLATMTTFLLKQVVRMSLNHI
jgi:hypothetical protein